MDNLPFTISPAAANWIRNCIQKAAEHPVASSHVPALVLCSNSVSRNLLGEITDFHSGEFLNLGWYPPETPAKFNFVELSLVGLKIYASPEAIEEMKGKELGLEPMEQAVPNAAGETRHVLTCR
jgi:hypothetical protein